MKPIHDCIPRPGKQPPLDYARERAKATGRAYIVSTMGHVMVDCAANRRAFRECGLEIAHVVSPR